jgi:ribonuclease D
VALDTEFVRERTFFQKLGLVQVSDGATIWLVDPLAVGSLEPLSGLLREPRVLKVLHSASEDLEVFHHRLGATPAPLIDTQIAAGMAGLSPSLGYGRLVQEMFGVELHKGETRTDWVRRPLSDSQLAYAAEDAAYLLPAIGACESDWKRWAPDWALADSAAPTTGALRQRPGSRRCSGSAPPGDSIAASCAAARELAAWREAEARRRDLPRSFVLKDDLLVQLASRRPLLRDFTGCRPTMTARGARGGNWPQVLERGGAPEDELPPCPGGPTTAPPAMPRASCARSCAGALELGRRAGSAGVPAHARRRAARRLARPERGRAAGAGRLARRGVGRRAVARGAGAPPGGGWLMPRKVAVMPAFDAARTVERTVRDIPAGAVDEVILVDDGSRDDTARVARDLGLRVLQHRQLRLRREPEDLLSGGARRWRDYGDDPP